MRSWLAIAMRSSKWIEIARRPRPVGRARCRSTSGEQKQRVITAITLAQSAIFDRRQANSASVIGSKVRYARQGRSALDGRLLRWVRRCVVACCDFGEAQLSAAFRSLQTCCGRPTRSVKPLREKPAIGPQAITKPSPCGQCHTRLQPARVNALRSVGQRAAARPVQRWESSAGIP